MMSTQFSPFVYQFITAMWNFTSSHLVS